MSKITIPKGSKGQSSVAQPVARVEAMSSHLHMPDSSRFVSRRASAPRPAAKSAIFLDRDGVIVEDVHYLCSPSQLRILPGVAQALRSLQDRFYLIVVTNQSAIARGLLTEDGLLTIHAELVRLLNAEAVILDALYYCPHLPEAALPAYRAKCDYRKPGPGMLLQATSDWGIDLACSYIVGDSLRDTEAGVAAGVTSVLLGNGRAPDLTQAARFILTHAGSSNRLPEGTAAEQMDQNRGR